jgi:sulfite reductase (NADPH) flavoprotein alpha-component
LKSTGRFLIGLAALLLCLIAVTGVKLIAKRQGGFKRWFSKVIKENFNQYYHVVVGRYTLIPIIIVSLTGVFLSLERFSLLPKADIIHQSTQTERTKNNLSVSDFEIFKNTRLNALESIEFPFSEDEGDYFIVALKDKEVFVNQYSGDIVSKAELPLLTSLLNWSIVLHTGRGTIVWSIVLLITCIAILFFMYSGFAMSVKRRRKSTTIKNKFDKNKAEYVVLVGSETGSTFRFAKQFSEALMACGKSVFIDSLNNYTTYSQAKQLIVFTATYGEGDAPVNAKNFEELIDNKPQKQTLNYAVLGFGSLMYPGYCKFAIVVDALLQKHPKFNPVAPLGKINNQSFTAFEKWAMQWNNANGLDLKIKPKLNPKKLESFTVVSKSELNKDGTFLIELESKKKAKFRSGDLLAFYPEGDNVERLYSIGKIDNRIILSIKKHEFGVSSNYFSALQVNDRLVSKLKPNTDFHFPKNAKDVILIANGTGIAPFLGMINETKTKTKTHLFWGGRTKDSLDIYANSIDNAFAKKTLSSFYAAYSQEEKDKIYVQDIILEQQQLIADVLSKQGIIMICGSIAMQNRVLEAINQITNKKLKQPLSYFETNKQLKMDCY